MMLAMAHQVIMADPSDDATWILPDEWLREPADIVWCDGPWSILSAAAMYREVGRAHPQVMHTDEYLARLLSNCLDCATDGAVVVLGLAAIHYRDQMAAMVSARGPRAKLRQVRSRSALADPCWLSVCDIGGGLYVPESTTPYRALVSMMADREPGTILFPWGWPTNQADIVAAEAAGWDIRVATIHPEFARWATARKNFQSAT